LYKSYFYYIIIALEDESGLPDEFDVDKVEF
jgi:hypothetical protein